MGYPTHVFTRRLKKCGCGNQLLLYSTSNAVWEFHYDGRPADLISPAPDEIKFTYYVECSNPHCRMAVGRRYSIYESASIGEFTDEDSAIEAANRAVSGCGRDNARIDIPPGFDGSREGVPS